MVSVAPSSRVSARTVSAGSGSRQRRRVHGWVGKLGMERVNDPSAGSDTAAWYVRQHSHELRLYLRGVRVFLAAPKCI